MDVWPQPAKEYNTILRPNKNAMWAQSRKCNMGQTQKVHAEANAKNTGGAHDVERPSATTHHVVIHNVIRWYFQHLPQHLFMFFVIVVCPILYFQPCVVGQLP